MKNTVYLDDFLKFLENSGIDTNLLTIVEKDIDPEYILPSDSNGASTKNFNSLAARFQIKKDSDIPYWSTGSFFYELL